MHQREKGQAQPARIQQRPVADDDTGIFQRADPPKAGRGGQTDALGEFLVADSAFDLQDLQDSSIKPVELHKIASAARSKLENCSIYLNLAIMFQYIRRYPRKRNNSLPASP
jgi:hypothetical protein